MHYINTLRHELSTAKLYEHNRLDETSVVNSHRCHTAAKFGVFVDEDHSKLPTLYWLPKLHKRPYQSRFIANSSSCTIELSIRLTSCLNAIENHVVKCCIYLLHPAAPSPECYVQLRCQCKDKSYILASVKVKVKYHSVSEGRGLRAN